MTLIRILYEQLSQEQRSYFNLKHQIGPYAYPYESPIRSKLHKGGSLSVSNSFFHGPAPFPDRRAIGEEIRDIWGTESIPMEYFREIFRAPNTQHGIIPLVYPKPADQNPLIMTPETHHGPKDYLISNLETNCF